MEKLLSQIQSTLGVLAAILPFAPAKHRAAIAETLETVAATLKLGELAAGAALNLAAKFAALRDETVALAQMDEADLEAAFERVRAASAAFRAAYAQPAPR